MTDAGGGRSPEEALRAHLDLWRAYVQPHAQPDVRELWGAVRSAVDWVPPLLDRIAQLESALSAARAHIAELDICSVCLGTGMPGGTPERPCPCGDGTASGEMRSVRAQLAQAKARGEALEKAIKTCDEDEQCRLVGHDVIDDHCGKPAHRYCMRCGRRESEIEALRKAGA